METGVQRREPALKPPPTSSLPAIQTLDFWKPISLGQKTASISSETVR